MKESIFLDQIRDVFAVLDRGVYRLITIFSDTIQQLATTTIISGSMLNEIASKVYALIALFMIFKISFSLINFLVNPDLIADKAKGGGALVKNVILTFVLIITVPFAFDILYEAQRAILSDGIIEKYILGGNDINQAGYTVQMSEECGGILATTSNVGDYVGLMAFKPFFQLDESKDAVDFENAKEKYCLANTDLFEGKASVSNLLKGRDVYDAPHGVSFNHYYVVDYTIFLSTVIGVVIALLYLSFCIDIAVRTIKLQFLELIAPVPIISYIDPDSSKNGMFKKWMKETFNTWLSLFMRLASIYFAVFIIGLLSTVDIAGNSLWIKLLIIIGALIFAKQLPKMVEDILGIKNSGKFTLNPFKKFGDEALGSKAITTLGAGAAGAIGGGVAGFTAGRQSGAPLRGTLLGISGGFGQGKSDPKHALTKGMTQTYKNMTGNDMVNMTPTKIMMGLDGKGKEAVNDVKAHLKTARNRYNAEQIKLNQATHHNALASEKLRSSGIDLNNLSSAKTSTSQRLSELSSKRSELSDQLSSTMKDLTESRNKFNEANNLVNNYKPSAVFDDGTPVYSQEYMDAKKLLTDYNNSNMLENLENDYNKINNEYQKVEEEYKDSQEIISAIDGYESSLKEEKDIRANISKIEKEIKTLGDEKNQRERFWQVDTSPKTSVEEAMRNNPK